MGKLPYPLAGAMTGLLEECGPPSGVPWESLKRLPPLWEPFLPVWERTGLGFQPGHSEKAWEKEGPEKREWWEQASRPVVVMGGTEERQW